MDNDGRETCIRNPEESRCQTVEGDNDDDCSEDTSRGSTNTGLRLESRTRERTGGGVSRENSADKVSNTDGDEFLVGVNFVAIDTAESYFNINEDNL